MSEFESDFSQSEEAEFIEDRWAWEDPMLFNNEEELVTGLCSDMLYEYNERDDNEELFLDVEEEVELDSDMLSVVDVDDYDQILNPSFDYGCRGPPTNRSSNQVATQTQQDDEALEVTCQVCFESLFDGNRIAMTTECGHMFCKSCLDQVLNVKKECPLCRATIYRVFRLYF